MPTLTPRQAAANLRAYERNRARGLNPATMKVSHSSLVSGNLITPNVAGGRMSIIVTDEDFRRWNENGSRGTVTDLVTGSTFTLAPDACGLGCRCGTKVVA